MHCKQRWRGSPQSNLRVMEALIISEKLSINEMATGCTF